MINFESFVSTYGYPALIIGTFLEGETILVIGGFLAHLGYLDLSWVIICAFLGTFAGDQLYFWMGRTQKVGFLTRRPFFRQRIEKAQDLLARHQKLIGLGFRFVYGIRTITPFALGLSKIKAKRFFCYNALSGVVWAVAVGGGGYLFGDALEVFIGKVKHYELATLAAMIFVAFLVWLANFYRHWISKLPPK